MANDALTHLRAFLKLGRPLFLLGGFVFHGLGLTIAWYEGSTLNIVNLILGQLAISSVQLMTHYSNEYFDLPADRANRTITYWAGSSRILVETQLKPETALTAGKILAFIAFMTIILLTILNQNAPFTAPLLLLALGLAAQYSAPPLMLHWQGLGAVAAAIIVPTLTTLVGYYLQTAHFTRLPLLIILPLALIQAASIILLDFPDRLGDEIAGKRTLVVRRGPIRAARIHLALILLCYLSLPLLYWWGLPGLLVWGSGLLAPAGLWLSWQLSRVSHNKHLSWNWLGFGGIALLIGTALLQIVTLLLKRIYF